MTKHIKGTLQIVTVVGRIQIHGEIIWGQLRTNKIEGEMIQHTIYCSNQAYIVVKVKTVARVAEDYLNSMDEVKII